MRIVYFHQYFSTPQGAWSARSYEMARRLVDRGHSVTMVCGVNRLSDPGISGPVRRGWRSGTVDGICVKQVAMPYSNYLSVPRRSWVFLRVAFKAVAFALRGDYDLFFATSTPLTAAIPGICAKLFRGKKFVFEVRDLWPEVPRQMGAIRNPIAFWALLGLEWLAYRTADACIALSPGIEAGIRRRSRLDLPVSMVPNVSDLELFRPGKESSERFDGTDDDDFVCVFTGAHGIANGLEAVLAAAKLLHRDGNRDVKFVFIGDGKKKPELIRRADEAGLDNCIFLDPVPREKLANTLASADVGLMILANIEGFQYGTSPNKFFDYISAGLPVIVNYPGWLAELVTEQSSGLAVPSGEPAAFVEAVNELKSNPILAREMGERSRQLAKNEFSLERLSNRFADFLENV